MLTLRCRNLQDAICAYLEYSPDSVVIQLPEVKIVAEDGTADRVAGQTPSPLVLPPNSSHTKCWQIANPGKPDSGISYLECC